MTYMMRLLLAGRGTLPTLLAVFATSAHASFVQIEIAGNADTVTIDGVQYANVPYVFSFTANDNTQPIQDGRFQVNLPFALDFPGIRDMGTSSSHAIIDIVQSASGLMNIDVSSGGTFFTFDDFGGYSDRNKLVAFALPSPLSASVLNENVLTPQITFENGTTELFRDADQGALNITYAIPEPSTFAVVLIGLATFVAVRLRRILHCCWYSSAPRGSRPL